LVETKHEPLLNEDDHVPTNLLDLLVNVRSMVYLYCVKCFLCLLY